MSPHNSIHRGAAHCVAANWPAPENIIAFTTEISGGVSGSPFCSWNLAEHVGDSIENVAENRRRLSAVLPENTQLNWLEQVHGNRVLTVPNGEVTSPQADGWYSRQALQACCIMTADCVPILVCSKNGDQVAALHAGWRGVAGRIIDQGVHRFSAKPTELMVWIGPCISWSHFRVGNDVINLLAASMSRDVSQRRFFRHDENSSGHAYANLPAIVEQQCLELGIEQVFQSNCCSYSEPERFFSYRREAETGRNVSIILITK